jgi:hypothetical protein
VKTKFQYFLKKKIRVNYKKNQKYSDTCLVVLVGNCTKSSEKFNIIADIYKAKDTLEGEIRENDKNCSRNCTKFSKKFNIIADIYKAKDILDENAKMTKINHEFGGKCLVVPLIAQSLSINST